MFCGGSDSWNNSYAGSTNAILFCPDCAKWTEDGPEYAYYFDTGSISGNVNVILSDLTADLDIFVLSSPAGMCSSTNCITYGDSVVNFYATPETTYYILVDGYEGAVGDYTITMTCDIQPASCAEILLDDPGAADGIYWLDPMGTGDPFQTYCDMTGGRWTKVVNIVGTSYSHANEIAAVGDMTNPAVASKLSDEMINHLTSGLDYWRFECGTYLAYVTNSDVEWTSMYDNSEEWSIDRDMDGLTFECAASRPGYVFSDHPDCTTGHTNYGHVSDGPGCYHDGEGWGMNGALWAR